MKNQENVYKADSSRIIADYNSEIETIDEYNGRQILELLQNADDEQSEEVLIELNSNENIFKISNKGEYCSPFTVDGIKSLMVSNFSPKTTKKYIGNKGLGFRSIVNWSNKIIINSQNIDIEFSKEISVKLYDKICDKEQQKNISEKRKLPDSIKPIAFLAIPSIKDNPQNAWTTIIEIHYKSEKNEDIKNQLKYIKDEILLFVNHINKLIINIDNEVKIIERIKEKNLIYINNKLWTIYTNEHNNILPKELWDKENEEESYELKLALQENFNNEDNFLYSYFPTKINIDFPFIIHGTFDLNSSRNDLNSSKKNEFVLNQLVELIIATAKFLTKNEVSYKALEFLAHSSKNTTLDDLGFYSAIDNSIEELPLFPCVDNTYKKKSDIVYDNKWAEFIQQTRNENILPYLSIPYYGDLDFNSIDGANYIDEKSINNLSNIITDINHRVSLIYLVEISQDKKFALLVDNENNEPISLSDEVYTPMTKEFDFNIPDFVNIKFMNNELYNNLINKFNISSDSKSRDLQRKIKNITNIQSYEPAQVLQKIINQSNTEIKNKHIDSHIIIKKMIISLYENYKKLNKKTKIPDGTRIQLISKDKSIVDAKDLFLSKSYPSGKLTEELFNGIFEDSYFLTDVETFGFDKNEDIENIEIFFTDMLGVNKYTKFNSNTYNPKYEKFIFTKIDKPSNFKELSFELNGIDNLEKIIEFYQETNQYEKFILWILSDKDIENELSNKKTLKYFYRTDHNLYNAPSYILFQLISSEIFKDYLITNEKSSLLINNISINYDNELFKKYGIKKPDIESIILKIGAVDTFNKLSTHSIKRILNNLPINSENGELAQKIYQLTIKHYEENNIKNYTFDGLKLWAKKDNVSSYYDYKDVFYSNKKLPKRIMNSEAIIDYPNRQGKKIIECFGINDLEKIETIITEKEIHKNLTIDFQNFFEQIKPYILAYRIQKLEKDNEKITALNKLNKLDIKLCTSVSYSFNNIISNLENNDYISYENNNYVIKIEDLISLKKLRSKFNFYETFADIMSITFNIKHDNFFRDIIKDDVNSTEEVVISDIGISTLKEARILLGNSNEYFSFWRTIFFLKDIEYNYNSDENLLQNIKEDLQIKTLIENINYKDLSNIRTCEYIKELFNELKIDNIEAFNKSNFSYYKLNFNDYHIIKLTNHFNDNYDTFKQLLYNWCLTNSQEKLFLDLIGKYENNNITVDNSNIINIDYRGIIEKFVNETFQFSLKDTLKIEIDFNELYEKNKNKINFEKLLTNEDKSLAYFNEKINEVKNIIDNINKNEIRSNSENIKDIGLANISGAILNTPIISKKSIPSHKSYGTFNPNTDKKKKDIGDNAEQCVFNRLIHDFGKNNVKWMSKENDNAGYDIRYKNSNNIWKYVEVKTYSNGKFYLSKPEKEYAENHKENYEIFLVEFLKNKKCRDANIHTIENIDFSNEEHFKLKANKFEVFYNLHKKTLKE